MKMRYWTRRATPTPPGVPLARVPTDDERIVSALHLRRENDAAHLGATIARMARDAARPATGKGPPRRVGI
jgi:hypothetical protein